MKSALLTIAFLLPLLPCQAEEARRESAGNPNILFILADDLGVFPGGIGGPCLIKEDQLTLPQMLLNAAHLPSFASKRFQGSTQAGPHGDFIHELDSIVGELMKTLEDLGLAENTMVMFSSDNGPEVGAVLRMRADHGHDGARPWRGVKRDQWEGGHRVPFLVRWPGKIAAGSTSGQTVCLTDIMATCAAVSAAKLPDNAAGDSFDLLPVMLGKEKTGPIRPYTLHQTIGRALAIRRGPWKFLDHRGSGGNNYDKGELKRFALPETAPDAPGQLYNLETDPGEKVNLILQNPEIAKELKALLDQSKASGRSRPTSSF